MADGSDPATASKLPAELGATAPAIQTKGGAPWHAPVGGVAKGLFVNNSLTAGAEGKKGSDAYVPFIPANGNKVKWYTCGPTVYDSAHLGHARAYLTFDILRRIMEDYFGYDVIYHVNVTDVDDKIIKRARRNKLIADFVAANAQAVEVVIAKVDDAVSARTEKLKGKLSKLEASPVSADAPAKDREEYATDVKETALKLKQAEFSGTRIEFVKRAVADGTANVLADLEKDATGLGLPPTHEVMVGWPLSERLGAFAAYLAEGEEPDTDVPPSAAIGRLQELAAAVEKVPTSAAEALVEAAKDEVGEVLDNEMGATIRDHEIFNAHARAFENEFMEDMELLGIRPPDVLTRVTEYIDEIKSFVGKIVDNGMAYASNDSVYLSIKDFEKAGHHYRKLKPGKDTSEKEMAEGEGDLASGGNDEKRHKNDFALWKASKPGEPEWQSPWGLGRPGWHIECSAIASDVLGPYMDIHAGGIDLQFPHHDNELAQSEACFGHHQWVSYFFHAGHLHIKGLKMSKSLKNFITIRQALAKRTNPIDGSTSQTTARHIRLMFLMQAWDKPMDYSDTEVANARKRERRFKNFFDAVKDYLKDDWLASGKQLVWTPLDCELNKLLEETKTKVHEALCRNFSTKEAMVALELLVTGVNKALGDQPAHLLLRKAAVYVTKILRIFGVTDGNDDIGFESSGGAAASGGTEAATAPFINALLQFRDEVRAAARAKADPKDLLAACDRVRDDTLVDLGIRLEDAMEAGGSARWRIEDPEVLRREQAEKRAADAAKAREKIARKVEKLEKELIKARSAAILPADLFSPENFKDRALYTEFGADGTPTKMADGTDIPKKKLKAFQKQVTSHTKEHGKLLAKAGGEDAIAAYLAKMEEEIAGLKAQLD